MAKKYRYKCNKCGQEFLGREIGDWCPYCHEWVVCFYQTYMPEIFDGAKSIKGGRNDYNHGRSC